jgi:hypothetical protein
MHMFVDESERGGYLLAPTLLAPTALHPARVPMRELVFDSRVAAKARANWTGHQRHGKLSYTIA